MFRLLSRHGVSILTGIVALLPAYCALSIASAQTAPPAAKSTASPTGVTRHSSNARTGQIASLDTNDGTLVLKDRTGKTTTYILTEKTHYMKERRPAQASDFKVGDTVTLHIRKSKSEDTRTILELSDPATYRWMQSLHSKTTPAVIKEIGEDSLTVTIGADAMTYGFTERTTWRKAGKDAGPTDFKAGDKVFILPKANAYGELQARGVSDSREGATLEKERLSRTLRGTLKSLDASAKTITITTAAGEERTIPYTEETEIHQGKKTLDAAALKPGEKVSVSLKRGDTGDDFAGRIAISKGRGKAVAKLAGTTAPKKK